MHAATGGLARHRQVSEAMQQRSFAALSTQCISRRRCSCTKNACSQPGVGKTPAGVRSCATLCDSMLRWHPVHLSKEMRMHYKCMQPARGWRDTIRCQKLCNRMLRCSWHPVHLSQEMRMHYQCMQPASQGLAKHHQVSEAMRRHTSMLLAPNASLVGDALAL